MCVITTAGAACSVELHEEDKEETTRLPPAALPSPDFPSRAEQKSAKNEKCIKRKATDSTNPPSPRLWFSLLSNTDTGSRKPHLRNEGPPCAHSQSQMVVLPRTVKGQAGFSWESVHCPAAHGKHHRPSPAWLLPCEFSTRCFSLFSSFFGVSSCFVPFCFLLFFFFFSTYIE